MHHAHEHTNAVDGGAQALPEEPHTPPATKDTRRYGCPPLRPVADPLSPPRFLFLASLLGGAGGTCQELAPQANQGTPFGEVSAGVPPTSPSPEEPPRHIAKERTEEV